METMTFAALTPPENRTFEEIGLMHQLDDFLSSHTEYDISMYADSTGLKVEVNDAWYGTMQITGIRELNATYEMTIRTLFMDESHTGTYKITRTEEGLLTGLTNVLKKHFENVLSKKGLMTTLAERKSDGIVLNQVVKFKCADSVVRSILLKQIRGHHDRNRPHLTNEIIGYDVTEMTKD